MGVNNDYWRNEAWNGHGITLRFLDILNRMGAKSAPAITKRQFFVWDDDWL